ncbi:MAG: MscL family protein, partial [Oscillospiraceae bacterium]|nr:MscL family protein [Oscillospiraceae bacterium]
AVNFGNTIAVIIDFIIIAFAVFCMVKAINSFHRKRKSPPPSPLSKSPQHLPLRSC